MHRHKLGWVVASASVVALAFAGVALAQSDAQACEDMGGVYVNDNGTKSCTLSDPPGNNQGGVVKTDTDRQKGSFSSSHELYEGDCVKNHGGTHC